MYARKDTIAEKVKRNVHLIFVEFREALKRFVEDGLTVNKQSKCDPKSKHEDDFQMGQCLESIGVLAGDTRDNKVLFRLLIKYRVFQIRVPI